MTKHHKYEEESNTETHSRLKKNGWLKWTSISGISAIAAVLISLPVIKDGFAYGHDMIVMPSTVSEMHKVAVAMQLQIDDLQTTNVSQKIWQVRTDERLDNIEKLLTRVLDNQERQFRFASPKQQDNKN